MGIFDRFKKQKPKDETQDLARELSATAIKYAKQFHKNFDYSKNSIDDLEQILDYYSNDISTSNPTDNQIWSMSLIFGTYLGETMLKNGLAEKGYSWGKTDSSNIPLLIRNDGNYITPNDKVYKRLVNGPEDNVVYFYEMAMKMMA